MKNIKNKIKNLIASGATVALMASGCATTEEQPQNEEPTKIILSKELEENKNLSNSERVCFQSALKEARNKEADKFFSDANEKKYALSCFDACGGAFIKKGKDCKYVPSKYEIKNDLCSCNGQNIVPYKEKEKMELELAACQKICEAANTESKQYEADPIKTRSFAECVCKIVENNQNQR